MKRISFVHCLVFLFLMPIFGNNGNDNVLLYVTPEEVGERGMPGFRELQLGLDEDIALYKAGWHDITAQRNSELKNSYDAFIERAVYYTNEPIGGLTSRAYYVQLESNRPKRPFCSALASKRHLECPVVIFGQPFDWHNA